MYRVYISEIAFAQSAKYVIIAKTPHETVPIALTPEKIPDLQPVDVGANIPRAHRPIIGGKPDSKGMLGNY